MKGIIQQVVFCDRAALWALLAEPTLPPFPLWQEAPGPLDGLFQGLSCFQACWDRENDLNQPLSDLIIRITWVAFRFKYSLPPSCHLSRNLNLVVLEHHCLGLFPSAPGTSNLCLTVSTRSQVVEKSRPGSECRHAKKLSFPGDWLYLPQWEGCTPLILCHMDRLQHWFMSQCHL